MMKQIIFTIILVLISNFSVFAQSDQTNCPTIDVSAGGVILPGEPVSFSASIENLAKYQNIEYFWTISAGKIIEGQGTANIKVDSSDIGGNNVTATIEVKGLPENCQNAASDTTAHLDPPYPRLIDEFGKLQSNDVKAKIEEMYVELGNEPNAQGYIINYGSDKQIALREIQIQKAIAYRKSDSSRVTIVRGGANQNGAGVLTKIWIVPPGAANPQP